MNNFTQEEIKNLIALINLAPIKGLEAMTVAMLQQKLASMLTQESFTEAPATESVAEVVEPVVEGVVETQSETPAE